MAMVDDCSTETGSSDMFETHEPISADRRSCEIDVRFAVTSGNCKWFAAADVIGALGLQWCDVLRTNGAWAFGTLSSLPIAVAQLSPKVVRFEIFSWLVRANVDALGLRIGDTSPKYERCERYLQLSERSGLNGVISLRDCEIYDRTSMMSGLTNDRGLGEQVGVLLNWFSLSAIASSTTVGDSDVSVLVFWIIIGSNWYDWPFSAAAMVVAVAVTAVWPSLITHLTLSHFTILLLFRFSNFRKYFGNFHWRDLFVKLFATASPIDAFAGAKSLVPFWSMTWCRDVDDDEVGQQFRIDGFTDVRLSGKDLVEMWICGISDGSLVTLFVVWAPLELTLERKYRVNLLNVVEWLRGNAAGAAFDDNADGDTASMGTAKFVALWEKCFVELLSRESLAVVTIQSGGALNDKSFGRRCSYILADFRRTM